jgi:hypothetical protein
MRKMVCPVEWTNQKEHRELLDISAKLCLGFAASGRGTLIVVDTLSGDKGPWFHSLIRSHIPTASIRVVTLTISDEVLGQRLNSRPFPQFKDFEISRKISRDMLQFPVHGELILSTSELTVQQCLSAILDWIAAAKAS